MATYKVIQDIEAEDKLFGPLTLKQFIFACLAAVFGYLSFWSIINDLWFLFIVFLPPALFFGVLAFPYTKDQPTEVWLMAKLRFYFRPRRRIWDQDGIKELVTITVPKHEEKVYTDGLSTTEVKSRLRALADTIDTRGWAVKGQAINLAPQAQQSSSDRLLTGAPTQQNPFMADIKAEDDIYDEHNNSTAQHFNQMIQESEQKHRQKIVSQLQQPQQPQPEQPAQQQSSTSQNDYWFMRQPSAPAKPGTATFGATPVVMPGQKAETKSSKELDEEEKKLLDKIHENQKKPNPMNSHLKTIKPLSEQQAEEKERTEKAQVDASPQQNNADTSAEQSTKKQSNNPDILNLAHNDDLNIETIARQANKKPDKSDADEVVVSLH